MGEQFKRAAKASGHWAARPSGWIGLSIVVLFLDYLTGPAIEFPILLVIPVSLAAWHGGLKWGLVLSLILPLSRILWSTLGAPVWPLSVMVSNAFIRFLTLGVMALFANLAAERTREVKRLRRMMTLCSYCKRTLGPSGQWEALGETTEGLSGAELSYVVCPDCAHERYPAIFPRPEK